MKSATAWALAVALGLAALPAAADETADFYKDRTVTFTSAGGAGGGYGVYALLLSEHMGKHIPGNPNVIVTYMPGAGGVRAANHAYHVAPKDGTAILAPLQSLATLQLLGKKGLRYDAGKFAWIGRAVETTSGFLVWPEVAKDLDGFRSRGEDTVVGVTQPGAPNHIMAALLPYCTGAKVRIVSGYKGSSAIANAYKKKEVHGMALPLDSVRLVHAELMNHTFIAQSGFERSPHFPQVPLLLDICPDPEKRKIVEVFQTQEVMGRAYAAPPGTPAARVAALRRAFDATMKDPDFRAAAQKRKMELGPKAGAEMQKIVEAHIATESAVVARAKAAVGLK